MLPRLDKLLPLRSCLQNFYQWRYCRRLKWMVPRVDNLFINLHPIWQSNSIHFSNWIWEKYNSSIKKISSFFTILHCKKKFHDFKLHKQRNFITTPSLVQFYGPVWKVEIWFHLLGVMLKKGPIFLLEWVASTFILADFLWDIH